MVRRLKPQQICRIDGTSSALPMGQDPRLRIQAPETTFAFPAKGHDFSRAETVAPLTVLAALAAGISMSKPTRPSRPQPMNSRTTRTFFVTSSTWGRRSLFQSERMAKLFLDVLSVYRAQGRYLLHEFVLMPDHFHVLISVLPEMIVEGAVQLIKGGFSYRARKQLGFQGEIWQRGFSDELVVNVAGYRARCEYVRHNPVRARLARIPEDYPYGSAGSERKMDPMPTHLRGLKPPQ
jgi:REP-associated tyrosine transposase